MGNAEPFEYTIRPVKDADDIPIIVQFALEAMREQNPAYVELSSKSTKDGTIDDRALRKFREAFDSPDDFLFKAVTTVNGKELMIGVSHWFVGYISIPKVDPFDQAPQASDTSAEEITVLESARTLGSNAYISAIRGKKHVCMYQRLSGGRYTFG